jgi:hypothetical protein
VSGDNADRRAFAVRLSSSVAHNTSAPGAARDNRAAGADGALGAERHGVRSEEAAAGATPRERVAVERPV